MRLKRAFRPSCDDRLEERKVPSVTTSGLARSAAIQHNAATQAAVGGPRFNLNNQFRAVTGGLLGPATTLAPSTLPATTTQRVLPRLSTAAGLANRFVNLASQANGIGTNNGNTTANGLNFNPIPVVNGTFFNGGIGLPNSGGTAQNSVVNGTFFNGGVGLPNSGGSLQNGVTNGLFFNNGLGLPRAASTNAFFNIGQGSPVTTVGGVGGSANGFNLGQGSPVTLGNSFAIGTNNLGTLGASLGTLGNNFAIGTNNLSTLGASGVNGLNGANIGQLIGAIVGLNGGQINQTGLTSTALAGLGSAINPMGTISTSQAGSVFTTF